MNISYFMSILDLYLSRETEEKTSISITSVNVDKVKIDVAMGINSLDKTSFFMTKEMFIHKEYFMDFLDKFRNNLTIVDEKQDYNHIRETCYYHIRLSNGREVAFEDFSLDEINQLRSFIYGITYVNTNIVVDFDDDNSPDEQFKISLGETGYTGFLTLFLIVFGVLNVFIVTLWVFKNFL